MRNIDGRLSALHAKELLEFFSYLSGGVQLEDNYLTIDIKDNSSSRLRIITNGNLVIEVYEITDETRLLVDFFYNCNSEVTHAMIHSTFTSSLREALRKEYLEEGRENILFKVSSNIGLYSYMIDPVATARLPVIDIPKDKFTDEEYLSPRFAIVTTRNIDGTVDEVIESVGYHTNKILSRIKGSNCYEVVNKVSPLLLGAILSNRSLKDFEEHPLIKGVYSMYNLKSMAEKHKDIVKEKEEGGM